jgi:hypothetical protein
MFNGNKLLTWGFAAMTAIVVAGCDSGQEADKTPPADQPAKVTPPTTVPSTAAQASEVDLGPSYLFIKEVPDPRLSQAEVGNTPVDPNDWGPSFQFPRAKLAFTGKGGHRLTAVLFSDDPKEAIKSSYEGDRYIFRMPLQITDRTQLDGTVYRMAIPFDDGDDTSDGIWRKKDAEHLEPIDLAVRFDIEGSKVKVGVGGLFKQSGPGGETHWYHVRGLIPVPVEAATK